MTPPKPIRFYAFRYYLAILAFFSLAIVFFPWLVVPLFYMRLVLGFLLFYALSILIYSLLVIGLASLLSHSGMAHLRSWAVAFAVVFGMSAFFVVGNHRGVENKVKALMAQDISVSEAVHPASLAILMPPESHSGDNLPPSCTALCGALLERGDTSVVAVGLHREMEDMKEKENLSRIIGMSRRPEAKKKMPVANMLNAFEACGEGCIRHVKVQLKDMEYILVINKNLHRDGRDKNATINGFRTELFKRQGSHWLWVDRKTYVEAKKFAIPIVWLTTFNDNFFEGRLGLVRKSSFYNMRRYEGWESLSIKEYKRIFDVDLAGSKNENDVGRRMLDVALNGRSGKNVDTDGLNALFNSYLIEAQGRSLNDKDADTILSALADVRVTSGFREMRRRSYLQSKAFTNRAVEEFILDRILRSPLPEQKDVVRDISLLAEKRPEGSFKDFGKYLEKIAIDPSRRAAAWRVLARWADMGEAGYAPLLSLLRQAKKDGFEKDEGRAGFAALLGLCNLARSDILLPEYKNEVLSYIETVNGNTTAHNLTYKIAARAAFADGKPGLDWAGVTADVHKLSLLKQSEREAASVRDKQSLCGVISLDH